MHVPIWEQPSIRRKNSEIRKNFIISLALFDLTRSVVSNCLQSEGEPMGVNHGLGWHGVGVPLQKNRSNKGNFIFVSSQIVLTKWGRTWARIAGVGEEVDAPNIKMHLV